MTPKEKAIELYYKFYIPDYCFAKPGMSPEWKINGSKKTASNVVDELLKIKSITMYPVLEDNMIYSHEEFWNKVKQEIKNI